MLKVNLRASLLMLGIVLWTGATAFGQGTAFTYQGRLTDNNNPANGTYDMQFKLYNGVGNQQGSTITNSMVEVTNGVFSVQLDFNPCPTCFDGSARFLEISVRPAGSVNPYTILSPRQQVTSTPYSIHSLAATAADGLSVTCVNCVTSSQIQNVQGSQVTGSIAGSQISGAIPAASVPAGSMNYIQNGTSPQAMNFNISGTGTADIFNASTRYNLGGLPILSAGGTNNLFAGVGAGAANTGSSNAFFGRSAGQANTAGAQNAFFGHQAGLNNNLGTGNAFFGNQAGANNSVGGSNAFFGLFAGGLNTGGNSNSFFGESAGFTNTTGIQNTLIGASASVVANNLTNATAIGHRAQVSQSHSLILGSINGVNGATTTVNVGIGTTTPAERLHVVGNGKFTGDLTATGTLSAGIVNATSTTGQFHINGVRVLSTKGNGSVFVGVEAGQATTGGGNSFFGSRAGENNTTGFNNTITGSLAGQSNTTGVQNSFFGHNAGTKNTDGVNNTFIGFFADFEYPATSGFENTLLGSRSTASGHLSNATAIGANAKVSQDNSLVLGSINGINGATADTNVGIGTTVPENRLHVAASLNAGGTPANHVAMIENTSSGTSADVLALKINRSSDPDTANNYISFFKGLTDISVGSIQGNGSGGVVLGGPGADYAEWLPRLTSAERIQPGEIVGLHAGRITKQTRGATQVMAVSTGPIVAGNDPGENARGGYERVAFIGQVWVRVRGKVQAGDFIVASGLNEGTGVAVSPDCITSEQFGQVVGQAWESSADPAVKSIRTAVGLIQRDPTVNRLLESSRNQTARVAAMEARLTALESKFKKKPVTARSTARHSRRGGVGFRR